MRWVSTYGLIAAIDGWDDLVQHILVATVAPVLIAPPIAIMGMRRKIRIETLNDRLNYLLSHDHLTGAATRARLIEAYSEIGEFSALLLLDADKFKDLNDAHGHVTGDEALRHLAGAMRMVVRKNDIVARWGGEEFVILLNAAALGEATGISARLIELLNERHMPSPSGAIPVTVSIGVTVCDPKEKLESVIDRADAALYQAKLAGRNRYVVAQWASEGAADTERDRRNLRDANAKEAAGHV